MSGQSKKWWLSWIPQRYKDRAEERRIEGHVQAINDRFQPRMRAAKNDQEEHAIDQEWTENVEEYLDSLGALRTRRLQKLAEKWDVEIHADAWTSTRYENARYIYPAAQLKLLREIRAARRERIRWFFQIVVTPLIALLGLLVALVSLLTRK